MLLAASSWLATAATPTRIALFECFIKSQSRLPKNKTEQHVQTCSYMSNTLCIPLCTITLHHNESPLYSRSSSPASSACQNGQLCPHAVCDCDLFDRHRWVSILGTAVGLRFKICTTLYLVSLSLSCLATQGATGGSSDAQCTPKK